MSDTTELTELEHVKKLLNSANMRIIQLTQDVHERDLQIEHILTLSAQLSQYRDDFVKGREAGVNARLAGSLEDGNPYEDGELRHGWARGWTEMDDHLTAEKYRAMFPTPRTCATGACTEVQVSG